MSKIKAAKRTFEITYAIRDIVLEANIAREKGKKILPLNIGDPLQYDFETPRHLIEAVYNAMLNGKNGYSPSDGIEEAISAIKKEALRKGIKSVNYIFTATGASEAIELAMTALVNEGENVLIPYPSYPLYSAVLKKLGAEERPYYLDEENHWQPDVSDIESKIDKNTRAIVLINPNNPTGSVYSKEILLHIIEIAKKNDIVIFSDEIYDKLILEEETIHYSTASLDEEVCVITLNGLSKSYIAPGWRMGWCIVSGDKEKLEDFLPALQKLVRARICANHPEQYAIKTALEGDQTHLKKAIETLKERTEYSLKRLNSIKGIRAIKPKGAFYIFPSIDIPISDFEFAKRLVHETGVLVVHGSGFGQKEGTKHFRVVTLPDMKTLEKSYDLIEEFIRKNF